MARYYRKYKAKVREKEPEDFPKPWDFVLQKPAKPGLYCSDLLKNRYQIIQGGFYDGQYYYVFDHSKKDIIRMRNGEFFQLFQTIDSAMNYLGINSSESNQSQSNVVIIRKEKPTMQKSTRGRRDRGETALSFLRDTITAQGQLSDKEIAAIVKDKFPSSTYTNHYVKYIRKKMGVSQAAAA